MQLVNKPSSGLDLLKNEIGKFKLITLKEVIDELILLSHAKSLKKAKQAKRALIYSSRLKYVEYKNEELVDEKLIKYAVENKLFVATMDKKLMKRLIAEGINVISFKKDNIYIKYG
jgi:rRNA-processing protein FCF1